MIAAPFLLSIVLLLQGGFPPTDPSFFVGKWTTSDTTGPSSFEVNPNGGKLSLTIDRLNNALEGTAFLSSQQRPPRTVAITARSPDRLFIIRRDGEDVVVEMFSTYSDRPPLYWTARFAKMK